MTFDSLITIIALFIALYAITPKYRMTNLFLKFGFFDWVVVIISLLIFHYLQFYETFKGLRLTFNLGLGRYGFTPYNLSYLVILLCIITCWLSSKLSPFPKKKVRKLHYVSYELLRTKKYDELILLLEGNLARLEKIYNQSFLLCRLRKKLEPDPAKIDFSKGSSKKFVLKKALQTISRFLPCHQSCSDESHILFQDILYSSDFPEAMKQVRPYFVLRILDLNIREKYQFFYNFLTALYKDSASILYFELENNQNFSSHLHEYDLPTSNKLLHYLFSDAKVAEKHAVWNPISEAMFNELDDLARIPSDDPYNLACGDFHEIGKWKSSLFMGLFFYDIMVSSALHQGIEWHMWLMNLSKFAERIVRNYNPTDNLIDFNDEWPTKYHYLLYAIVSSLRRWIISIQDLPLDQANIKLDNSENTIDNGNIPKLSIKTLARSVYHILSSEKITRRFKNYIADIAFRLYFSLNKKSELSDYATILREEIRQGGAYDATDNKKYKESLFLTFEQYDYLMMQRQDVIELREYFS